MVSMGKLNEPKEFDKNEAFGAAAKPVRPIFEDVIILLMSQNLHLADATFL